MTEIEMPFTRRADGLFRVEIGGQNVFPVYGASGGLVARKIAYLIKQGEGEAPETLSFDLGLPRHAEPFKIVDHARGWRHAVLWADSASSVYTAAKELLSGAAASLPSAEDLDAVMAEQQIAQSTAQKFRVVK